jgi:alkylated DNA repair dioxygenase AlkB
MEDIKVIRNFLDAATAEAYFEILSRDMYWHDTLFNRVTDEPVKIPRKMAYVEDYPRLYHYANLYFQGGTWMGPLRDLRNELEEALGYHFNSVLLNYYENGKETINWHSDKEATLGPNPVIACVNLGATRKFWFRKKEAGSEKFYHELHSGDLLVMGEDCQVKYLHAILEEKDVKTPRISLTYRYNYDYDIGEHPDNKPQKKSQPA